MSAKHFSPALEALLFAAGEEGMTLNDLASTLGIAVPAVREQIDQWATALAADRERGVYLAEFGDRYKLLTKPDYADLIQSYLQDAGSRHLSQPAIEVLSIVAYQQPITRIEIDDIRGIHSAGALQTLLAHDLISEAGRKDAPGRPILYETTPAFLDYFGLQTLDDLPALTRTTERSAPATDLFASFNEQLNADTDDDPDAVNPNDDTEEEHDTDE